MTGEFLAKAAASTALVLCAVAGCNAITGSADLMVVGPTAGAGGGAGTGSAAQSSSSGTVEHCTYPTTGFGVDVGKVLVPHRSWPGYAAGSTATSKPTTISMDDFFDCDGTKHINALLVDTSALWCGACQQAAAEFDTEIKSSWGALGIKVITLMVDDAQPGQPATINTALLWKKQFNLGTSVVAADPGFTFEPAPDPMTMAIGLPVEMVVDPRTMKIVDLQQGYSGDYSSLVALAMKNGGK
jgi:hypothetical protein